MTYGVPIEPMAIAHRGGAALAPEKHIRRLPPGDRIVRYLETDVRTTADGELVCFHDATLDRVTDGRGRVQHHQLRTLRALRVGGTERIPTLARLLRHRPPRVATDGCLGDGTVP